MLLHHGLAQAAARHPEKAGAVFPDGALTFSALEALSNRRAAGLRTAGVARGDRVAILMDHRPEALITYWAVLKCGASAIFVNEQLPSQSLRFVIEDAVPRLLVTADAGTLEVLAQRPELLPWSDRLIRADDPRLDGEDVAPSSEDVLDTAIATIVYTSGSSGTPKGVCLTHRNLFTVASGVIEHMPITDRDSYFMVVPLHYVHGLMQLLVHTLAGATIHYAGGFAFPRSVLSDLQKTGVSGFSGVPYHFAALIDRGGFLDADLPNLRWITVTGGKMPLERIQQIRQAHPSIEIHIAYGQTECAPRATALHPSKIDRKPDSVGAPIPGVRVLLLDEAGNEVGPGEVGEIVVAGDNVMAGYWNQIDASREVIDAEGRLHTGDLGRFDDDGDLFLVGRRSEMIKSAGERIVPEEIERVLEQDASVAEAVVVGMPDPLYGQRVEAFVVTHEPLGDTAELERRLRQLCQEQMAFARAPKRYHFLSDLPRRANGKPDRQQLLHNWSTTTA